jgi:hypothetical protein
MEEFTLLIYLRASKKNFIKCLASWNLILTKKVSPHAAPDLPLWAMGFGEGRQGRL